MKKNNTQNKAPKPMLLCILDGFGISDNTKGNAVKLASTPTLDNLYANYPHSKLITHGQKVGLPQGQMGNSDVGHMTIGSGRVIPQSLEKIQQDLNSGKFEKRQDWLNNEDKLKNARHIHIVGLVSDGGVHSHYLHATGLIKVLEKYNKPVLIHAITDGRDTQPNDAKQQFENFTASIENFNNAHIASVSGRFYTMDRDNRSERTAPAYNMLKNAVGRKASSWQEALLSAAANSETDEFISPTILRLPIETNISHDDVVIFFNFRADRMRQIVGCFVEDNHPNLITMTKYDSAFYKKTNIIYPPEFPKNTLGEVIEKQGLNQLRIAESEKYAHVTFFFNGGTETPYKNEKRIVVPSPKVKTYNLAPEMSLVEITKDLCREIKLNTHDFIVLNIANGDQVGHSGDLKAAITAVECIDKHLAEILAEMEKSGGETIIIADHGNCEEMLQEDGSPATAHTTNPVPCIYVGRKKSSIKDGSLADVAPTILYLMGIDKPNEMEGECLISFL